MQKKMYFSPVAMGLFMSMATTAQAAEPVLLQTRSFEQLQQTVDVMLPGVAKRLQTPVNSFQMVTERVDDKHISHIRMQQEYLGFPVFGGYGILHSKATANTLLQEKPNILMTGTVFQGLEAELGQMDASFVAKGQIALQQFKSRFATETISEQKVEPMIYIDEEHHAFWAYKLSVLVNRRDGMPTRPTVIVDAKTSIPFLEWDDIKTNQLPAKGKGFGGNSRTGAHQFGVDLPLLDITRDSKTGTCYLKNQQVSVFDMSHNSYATATPMQFQCRDNSLRGDKVYWTGYQGDGYDVKNGAYSPSNDALYIGSVIYDMYKQWYGVHVLASQNKPMPLVMRVHYGDSYENAFWDGKQMTFGDGDTMMYPLVSLGVGAHEISHGFTEQHANLYYAGQSGGINESFSDMAAMASEFYAKGDSSWSIGSEIMKEDSGYDVLRYMDKPSRDGKSIDTATDYRKGMDVHYSSGVYNRLFYLLAHQPGWDVRSAFHVMLKANMDYWTPYATFEQGACGILLAAIDLNRSDADVKQALDAVKIDYQSC